MGKGKPPKAGASSVPHKHLHSRLSFLHQAATYLAINGDEFTTREAVVGSRSTGSSQASHTTKRPSNDSTRLLTQLRGVSRKAQIRLSPKVKHSVCKRCDTLLLPGLTSKEKITNGSKNGKKAKADMLEVRCENCRTLKRFPVGREIAKEDETNSSAR